MVQFCLTFLLAVPVQSIQIINFLYHSKMLLAKATESFAKKKGIGGYRNCCYSGETLLSRVAYRFLFISRYPTARSPVMA